MYTTLQLLVNVCGLQQGIGERFRCSIFSSQGRMLPCLYLQMEMTYPLAEMSNMARQFVKELKNSKVIAVKGEMGAGKTTFIHAVCDVLGVTSAVSSPTYPIINEYAYPQGRIFHIDLYRLKDEEEALQAGIEDCFYSGNLCFVEWPERAPGLFPEGTKELTIELAGDQLRRIKILDN